MKAAFFIAMVVSTGWCTDGAVVKGRVIDSSNAPMAGIPVTTRYALTAGLRYLTTDNAGNYSATYPGTEIRPDLTFTIIVDSLGTLQYTVAHSDSFPPSTNHNDGIADTLKVSDIVVRHLPKAPDSICIFGYFNYANTSPVQHIKGAEIKIKWQRIGATDYDTIKVKTDSMGCYAYTANNKYSISRVTCWADTTVDLCTKSSKVITDTLVVPLNLFDNKTDTLQVRSILLAKDLRPVAVLDRGSLPGYSLSSHGLFSVALYSLDGRLIKNLGGLSPDNFDAAARTACPAGAHIILAVWKENGRTVSRQVRSITK